MQKLLAMEHNTYVWWVLKIKFNAHMQNLCSLSTEAGMSQLGAVEYNFA